jgi:hypothetical protein
MAFIEIFIWGDTNCQPLALEIQTELLTLLLPCLGHCSLSDYVCLDTNPTGSLTIQGTNDLTETSNHVVESMHFVFVLHNTPHHFLVFFTSTSLSFISLTMVETPFFVERDHSLSDM